MKGAALLSSTERVETAKILGRAGRQARPAAPRRGFDIASSRPTAPAGRRGPGLLGSPTCSVLLAVAACAAGSIWAPPRAAAQAARRVVVERFRGPRGGAVRRALVGDLEDHGVVVVDAAEVRAARRRLDLGRRLEDAEYVELARELNADAIVEGRVRRARRRWVATVRVRSGADGAALGTERWGGRTLASLRAIGRNGHRRLRPHLEQARAPAAAAPQSPAGQEPWYARRDAPPAAPAEPEPEEPEPPRDASTRYDSVRIAVMGGSLFRYLETPVQVYAAQRGRTPADPASALLTETRRYQSSGIGHFELGARAELYPGAFDEQPFPYLGAVVSFSHSLGLQSNGTDRNTGAPLAVPTSQLELYVGARARYRFGPARSEPEIHLDAGWGTFQFDLAEAELQLVQPDAVIPPMQHGYVHLSGGLSVGVVPQYLSLGFDVGYRIGTNLGAGTRNVWGTETGPSNGFVMGIEAKLEVPEAPGLFFELVLSYFQLTTDFRGQVGCARAGACAEYVDPWEDGRLWEVWPVEPPAPGTPADLNAVVGGPTDPVHDNYVRAQLRVGYAFR
jgi:hypothetical protein